MTAAAIPALLEPIQERLDAANDYPGQVPIAFAPTDTARLLAAVKAVAEVHKPAKVQRTKYNADGTLISYTVTEDGPCVVCYPPFITQHCEECEDYDETCGGVTGAASRPWPCPTVSTVEAALRGDG